jgi:type II secretory pathway component GspD/PulD (secretin)
MKRTFEIFAVKRALLALAVAALLAAITASAQNNTFSPGASAIIPQTQSVETGPILDVIPYVLADGYTINLALIPSDTEFGGYDQLQLPQVTGNLNVVQLPTVLPKFTVRQVVTTVNVWDNQTVVLGGLITSTVNSTKDKVPIIGDVPLLGRLFQSQSKQTTKNNLMVFVTATIVDPSGFRVHKDDDLPFAQNNVPDQPKENVAPTGLEKTFQVPGQIIDAHQ